MEERLFFLLRLKSKRKAKRVEHILKTQLGVNSVKIDFESRLMKVNFDPDKISVDYMALVVHSVGSEMVVNENEASSWKNQLGNYLVLKTRRIILYLLSGISLITLLEHSSHWFLLGFSIVILSIYLSLFNHKSNNSYTRSFWIIDKIGILLSSMLIITGVLSLYYHKLDNFTPTSFILSIIILELITIYRWLKEKKSAEMDLL